MDIYLTELKNKKKRFRFPSLPEEITVSGNTNYHTYDIIGQGTIKIPRGTDVKSIEWSGDFFGKAKRKERMIRKWVSPTNCKNQLTKWRENGTVLRLMVTGTNINYDVTIEKFQSTEYGAYGNCEYSISFLEYNSLKVYTTNEIGLKGKKKSSRPSSETSTGSKNYKVVKGDSLWKIARKNYGTGTKWEKIYNANKDKIEKTAKKHGKKNSSHGHWIWPGEILIIP